MQSTPSGGLKDFETAHGEPDPAVEGGFSQFSADHGTVDALLPGRDEGLGGGLRGRVTGRLLSLLGSRAWCIIPWPL